VQPDLPEQLVQPERPEEPKPPEQPEQQPEQRHRKTTPRSEHPKHSTMHKQIGLTMDATRAHQAAQTHQITQNHEMKLSDQTPPQNTPRKSQKTPTNLPTTHQKNYKISTQDTIPKISP